MAALDAPSDARSHAREGRGRLKVFLGAAPGVGKTYAMLEAAQVRLREGADVVAAVIETHGRAETEALLHGIPVLPRQARPYRGRILTEMDLDGLLARRPDLALVDELAHANVEGGRHEKRWQDVEEALAAGIDVWTTLNVQHVETLNATVARITGVRVRETVPDRLLEEADEIELVDLPPDELLARLRSGKVYVQDQAARAVQAFFTKANLVALRELSMRAAADRVDAQLREHMAAHAIPGPWPAQERILVLVTADPATRDAIRVAKRSADRARTDWVALAVLPQDASAAAREAVAQALRLAERLGAEVATVEAGGEAVAEVLEVARRRNVRRIVLGRPARRGWAGRLAALAGGEDLARALIRRGRDFEITLASGTGTPAPTPEAGAAAPRDWRPYVEAPVAVAAAAALAWAADSLFPVTSLSLIFMTAVIAVASRQGLGPAIAASALGFLAYNFLFTDPRFTFRVSRQGEVLTLVLFLAASIVTGNLAARLRARVASQGRLVARLGKLQDVSRRLALATTTDDVVWAAVSNLAGTLGCDTVLLVPDAGGSLAVAGGFPPEDRIETRDMTAALYAWSHGEAAGRGTGTLPAARWLFVPLQAGGRVLAVLGLGEGGAAGPPAPDRPMIDSLADQVGLALERARLAEELAGARVAGEADRLRTALLSSVSHDLRTPLVTIIGAADSLAEAPGLSEDDRLALAETIREEGGRLDRYVQNLLDMTRLEHGALRPSLAEVEVGDLVAEARRRLRLVLAGRPLEADLAPDLPPLRADPVLAGQVLVNVIDNAARHAPGPTQIRVVGRSEGASVAVAVEDQGPGIPEAERARVFDMFHRVEGGDGGRTGTGLGLAIAKGLVEAQGGTIRAEARPGGGTRMVLTLPAAAPP